MTDEQQSALSDAITPSVLSLLDAVRAKRARIQTDAERPRSRAWITKKTAWFVLARRSTVWIGTTKPGDWITVTRTHSNPSPASRKRLQRVIEAMKAQQA